MEGLIGKSVPRVDGREKATGRLGFVSDYLPPKALIGKIFRSPIPHGRIVRLDLEDARKAAIKAARIFKEHSDMREMALAYELLGGLAERRGDVTEARAWLRASVETWRNAGDDTKTAE